MGNGLTWGVLVVLLGLFLGFLAYWYKIHWKLGQFRIQRTPWLSLCWKSENSGPAVCCLSGNVFCYYVCTFPVENYYFLPIYRGTWLLANSEIALGLLWLLVLLRREVVCCLVWFLCLSGLL